MSSILEVLETPVFSHSGESKEYDAGYYEERVKLEIIVKDNLTWVSNKTLIKRRNGNKELA